MSLVFVGGSSSPAECLGCSRDFKWVWTGHASGAVIEYDWYRTVNRQRVAIESGKPSAGGSGGRSGAAAASQSTGRLAVVGPQPAVKAGEWSTAPRVNAIDESQKRKQPVDSVTAIAPQPEAVWCLTGHTSGKVRLSTCRVEKGRVHHVFEQHSEPVAGIELLPATASAVSVGLDGAIVLNDLNTGGALAFKASLPRRMTSVECYRADNEHQLLSTPNTDGTVCIWSVRGGSVAEIALLPSGARATSTAWSPGGGELCVGHGDGSVSLWDVRHLSDPIATTSVSAMSTSPTHTLSCPRLLVGKNSVHAVRPLREDYVAVAADDAIRIFKWSDVLAAHAKGFRDSGRGILLGSAGVGAMLASDDGRFLFTSSFKCSPPQNLATLGYDLTDVIGLEPPQPVIKPEMTRGTQDTSEDQPVSTEDIDDLGITADLDLTDYLMTGVGEVADPFLFDI